MTFAVGDYWLFGGAIAIALLILFWPRKKGSIASQVLPPGLVPAAAQPPPADIGDFVATANAQASRRATDVILDNLAEIQAVRLADDFATALEPIRMRRKAETPKGQGS